jgi:hypothetical protein
LLDNSGLRALAGLGERSQQTGDSFVESGGTIASWSLLAKKLRPMDSLRNSLDQNETRQQPIRNSLEEGVPGAPTTKAAQPLSQSIRRSAKQGQNP